VVRAGFAYFSVATQDPEVKLGFIFQNIEDSKMLQQLQTLGKVNLTHRYQLEERFVHNASKLTLKMNYVLL
jgi:hypothetical protein